MSDPVAGPGISERRLHPAYLLISAGRSIRALVPAIAIGIWRAPGWLVAAFAAVLAIHALVEWWFRRYSVSASTFRLSTGLFKRTRHSIGIEKITSLEAERGVVQRILRVWSLKIQTPGSDHHATLKLACLSASALEELRDALDQRVPAVLLTKESPAPETLAVLSTRTLLLAAVTGTSVPLILAGAGAAYGRARDLLPENVFRHLSREVFVGGPTTALLLLTAAVLAVLAGIALTALRLARFTLTRDGDRLRISRGLIAQRSGTIQVDRVQAVRLVEGLWRRMLGYCAIEVEVAGISSSNDTERMLFPLARTDRAAELVRAALPELHWTPRLLDRVPAPARRRYFTLPLLLGAVLTLGLLALPGWGSYLAWLPLPVALLTGWGQARDAAWSVDETTVSLRWRRVLARHTVIARRRRVQLSTVSRTPFQRRAGLAGLTLTLSSRRRARLRHLDVTDAVRLLHVIGRPLGVADPTPEPITTPYREQ